MQFSLFQCPSRIHPQKVKFQPRSAILKPRCLTGRAEGCWDGVRVVHGRPVPSVPVRRGTCAYSTPRSRDPLHRWPDGGTPAARRTRHHVHHAQGASRIFYLVWMTSMNKDDVRALRPRLRYLINAWVPFVCHMVRLSSDETPCHWHRVIVIVIVDSTRPPISQPKLDAKLPPTHSQRSPVALLFVSGMLLSDSTREADVGDLLYRTKTWRPGPDPGDHKRLTSQLQKMFLRVFFAPMCKAYVYENEVECFPVTRRMSCHANKLGQTLTRSFVFVTRWRWENLAQNVVWHSEPWCQMPHSFNYHSMRIGPCETFACVFRPPVRFLRTMDVPSVSQWIGMFSSFSKFLCPHCLHSFSSLLSKVIKNLYRCITQLKGCTLPTREIRIVKYLSFSLHNPFRFEGVVWDKYSLHFRFQKSASFEQECFLILPHLNFSQFASLLFAWHIKSETANLPFVVCEVVCCTETARMNLIRMSVVLFTFSFVRQRNFLVRFALQVHFVSTMTTRTWPQSHSTRVASSQLGKNWLCAQPAILCRTANETATSSLTESAVRQISCCVVNFLVVEMSVFQMFDKSYKRQDKNYFLQFVHIAKMCSMPNWASRTLHHLSFQGFSARRMVSSLSMGTHLTFCRFQSGSIVTFCQTSLDRFPIWIANGGNSFKCLFEISLQKRYRPVRDNWNAKIYKHQRNCADDLENLCTQNSFPLAWASWGSYLTTPVFPVPVQICFYVILVTRSVDDVLKVLRYWRAIRSNREACWSRHTVNAPLVCNLTMEHMSNSLDTPKRWFVIDSHTIRRSCEAMLVDGTAVRHLRLIQVTILLHTWIPESWTSFVWLCYNRVSHVYLSTHPQGMDSKLHNGRLIWSWLPDSECSVGTVQMSPLAQPPSYRWMKTWNIIKETMKTFLWLAHIQV